jgi:hypothetical protein
LPRRSGQYRIERGYHANPLPRPDGQIAVATTGSILCIEKYGVQLKIMPFSHKKN